MSNRFLLLDILPIPKRFRPIPKRIRLALMGRACLPIRLVGTILLARRLHPRVPVQGLEKGRRRLSKCIGAPPKYWRRQDIGIIPMDIGIAGRDEWALR